MPPRVADALAALADQLGAEVVVELDHGPVLRVGDRPPRALVTTFALTTGEGVALGRLRVAVAPDGASDDVLDLLAATVVPLVETCLDLDGELLDAGRRTVRSRLAAQTDTLTGIGNRRAFDRALDDVGSGPAAVVVVDLDGLKEVNDTEGHAAGDALITAAATALRQSSRGDDVVARLGGDEFGLVLPDIGRSAAGAVVARLEASLRAAGVSASIGIAIADAGTDARTALAAADADMYATKVRRRGGLPQPRGPMPLEHTDRAGQPAG